ncbi:MAG: ABC transporter ATP-binding protein [Hydrogenobacter thermophilus]|uniref:sulfate/molybdate ABC transporter ATP-binding protein n=1 Tax=Hydrogenobacter thermophilus TaxID=940 RepID=UPI001C78B26F|nr:MAG: ABC transporter ATP-binding protein [Hydrogenobacter thermophilus]
MIRLWVRKRLYGPGGDFFLDVELEVSDAEFLLIFGPSGAGKTTLLRIIAGLEKPDEGYVEVDGEVWHDSKKGINLPPQKRDVGFVFQDYALFPNMTVAENIAYGMKKKDPQKVLELLKIARMEALKDRKPSELSGGQKQRVALLRAIAREPKLLLLDEPLSALDQETASALRDEIKAFQRKYRIPTFMVSHSIEDVLRLADRVLRIENGQVKAFGTPREVLFSKEWSPKFSLTGVLLEKVCVDVVCILSIAIGSELVQVVVDRESAQELSVGDTLLLSTKAFVPVVKKLHSPHLNT